MGEGALLNFIIGFASISRVSLIGAGGSGPLNLPGQRRAWFDISPGGCERDNCRCRKCIHRLSATSSVSIRYMQVTTRKHLTVSRVWGIILNNPCFLCSHRLCVQQGHYVYTSSVPLSVRTSVPWLRLLTRRVSRAATLSVWADSFLCQHGLARTGASPLPSKRGIVCRPGKSIILQVCYAGP